MNTFKAMGTERGRLLSTVSNRNFNRNNEWPIKCADIDLLETSIDTYFRTENKWEINSVGSWSHCLTSADENLLM